MNFSCSASEASRSCLVLQPTMQKTRKVRKRKRKKRKKSITPSIKASLVFCRQGKASQNRRKIFIL